MDPLGLDDVAIPSDSKQPKVGTINRPETPEVGTIRTLSVFRENKETTLFDAEPYYGYLSPAP